jgi:hypothetical protein
MRFKEFLLMTENSSRTGAKLGLYPPQSDALGQYPPLYGIPSSADLITYLSIAYPDGIKSKNGIVQYEKRHKRHA